MSLDLLLTGAGLLITALCVWYSRRAALTSEKALELAQQQADEIQKERELTVLEKIILMAAHNAPTGYIFYHRHFEGNGPHLIFWTYTNMALSPNGLLPGHEPVPDPHASLERLVSIHLMEKASDSAIPINLSTKSNVFNMAQFNTFRLTPHGRARLATISQSVDDYLSENEFLNFRPRC